MVVLNSINFSNLNLTLHSVDFPEEIREEIVEAFPGTLDGIRQTVLYDASKGALFLENEKEKKVVIFGEKTVQKINQALEKADAFIRKEKIKQITENCVKRQIYTLLPKRGQESLYNRVVLPSIGLVAAYANLVKDTLEIVPKEELKRVKELLGKVTNNLGMAFSLLGMKNSLKDYQRAVKVEDREGAQEAEQNLFKSSLQLIIGATGILSKSLEKFQLPSASSVAKALLFPLTVAANALGLAISIRKIKILAQFQKKIDTYWLHPALSEEEKIEGVLSLFQKSLTLSLEEQEKLENRMQKPLDEKELQEKTDQWVQKKLASLLRRMGNKSFEILVKGETMAELWRKVKEGQIQSLKEAKKIIEVVREENLKRKISATLLFAASTLGVFAFFLSQLYGPVLAIWILKELSSAIWVAYSSYRAYLYFKYRPETGYDRSYICSKA